MVYNIIDEEEFLAKKYQESAFIVWVKGTR